MFYQIIKEIYRALLVAIIIFIIMEIIEPGLVISFISLNLLLIFWFISGIILLLVTYK